MLKLSRYEPIQPSMLLAKSHSTLLLLDMAIFLRIRNVSSQYQLRNVVILKLMQHLFRADLTSLQALDLTRIVSCNLNPLRYCHTTTVLQFAESATHLQVVYCHTIIKRDQRRCLPETDAKCLMDTEYPFEKYLLQGSSHIINPLLIDKPIGREDSLYDSDQVMEELLSESPRLGGFMHQFLG